MMMKKKEKYILYKKCVCDVYIYIIQRKITVEVNRYYSYFFQRVRKMTTPLDSCGRTRLFLFFFKL